MDSNAQGGLGGPQLPNSPRTSVFPSTIGFESSDALSSEIQ